MKHDKDLTAKFESAIKDLPEKAQNAVYWAITHFDLVEQMCKASDMTIEEIETLKKNAREKEDYTLLVLLCAAQVYKTTRRENR